MPEQFKTKVRIYLRPDVLDFASSLATVSGCSLSNAIEHCIRFYMKETKNNDKSEKV